MTLTHSSRSRLPFHLGLLVAAALAMAIAPTAALAAPPPPAPQYTMTDLGTLHDGDLESHAQFINKRGQVAGEAIIASAERHHFFWDGAAMHDLGAGIAAIVGLNDQGQVALNVEAAPYTVRAALWSDGILTDLGPLPGDLYSRAYGINNSGQVVGTSSSGGVTHGVIWKNGTITTLGFLGGGDDTFATLINDAGQVAGYAVTGLFEQHAFFWDRGVMTDLSLPLPQVSVICHCVGEAVGLNNRGQVVGSEYSLLGAGIQTLLWEGASRTVIADGGSVSFYSADGIDDRGEVSGTHWTFPGTGYADNNPFFWRDGVMTEWNADATTSQSNAMNRNGVVVGEATTDVLGVRGFVWDAGQLTELENASYSSAAAVNDRGVIAGSAAIDRSVHAVIWTPTRP